MRSFAILGYTCSRARTHKPHTMRAALLLLVLAARAAACPFYSLAPAANYSSFTAASAACQASGQTLHVCANATIAANETVPAIYNPLVIAGDVAADGSYAVLFALTAAPGPVLVVAGGARVTVSTLAFWFNDTMFAVQDTALLALAGAEFYIGNVAVAVACSTLASGSGLVASEVVFGALGIGIAQTTGAVVCTTCIFNSPRAAAVSIGASTNFPQLALTWSQWINIRTYIAVGATPTSAGTPLPLTANWGRLNHNTQTATYDTICNYTPSRAPHASHTPRPCPACPRCNDEPHPWNIALLAVTVLSVIVMGTISVQFRNRTPSSSLR